MIRPPPRSTLFPYTNALPICDLAEAVKVVVEDEDGARAAGAGDQVRGDVEIVDEVDVVDGSVEDRKSTRLNSSHTVISYAVFCLKKKTKKKNKQKEHVVKNS